MGASSCSREGARMGLAGTRHPPSLPIHRSLSYCAPCLHPPHTTIRPLTSRPAAAASHKPGTFMGGKGGKSALENFGFVAGGASPRFRRGAYVGRGDLACFPLPLDSISSGHPRKQAATQGRRGGGLAECSMLSSVGRRTTVVLTTGPLWDQYDARRDVCSPTPHRLTLGALREFKFAPL